MIRALFPLSLVVFALLGGGTALAQTKTDLDNSFAHIKHGELFLNGQQGSQHSIGSHTGWARGQSERVVRVELVAQALLAYHGLVTNTKISKANLDQAFAYIKQGALILTGRTGPQHSIGSHLNWAKGQTAQSVIAAIAAEMVSIRTALLPKL
jgi:hypothetical protein